jgi:hypothetical protein
MIKFMVIGAPRSGTAWAANWMTCGDMHCIHDPLWDHHYADLDKLEMGEKGIGVACTGLALFPDWVNSHPCRKVILHREPKEIQTSLRAAGYPPCPRAIFKGLEEIQGMHLDWTALLREPNIIWRHLFQCEADLERHRFLCTLNVTANTNARTQDPEVLKRLQAETSERYHAAFG